MCVCVCVCVCVCEYYSREEEHGKEMGLLRGPLRLNVYTGFWWENVSEWHLEDVGLDGKIILKWNFKK